MDYFEKKYLEQFGISSLPFQYLCYIMGIYAPCVLAKILYKRAYQKSIDLRSPKNLNEKINWLEFNTDTMIWSLLADKLLARKYVMMQGYESILTKLYNVWENVNTIDFTKLPESFVLKCNHDSGSAQVVLNKTDIDIREIIVTLKKRMMRPYGIVTAEPHYRQIKRAIFAEELILSTDNTFDGPINYKFWCFHGEVAYCHVQYRLNNGKRGAEIYKLPQWEYLSNALTINDDVHIINAPTQLNKMMDIASKLSRIFPQCRVDLYESDKRVVFGELTFTAGGGRINDYTIDFLQELGDKVIITSQLNYDKVINGIKSYGTI